MSWTIPALSITMVSLYLQFDNASDIITAVRACLTRIEEYLRITRRSLIRRASTCMRWVISGSPATLHGLSYPAYGGGFTGIPIDQALYHELLARMASSRRTAAISAIALAGAP